MAANDEFPRGLALTQTPATSSGASISYPATPGIAWILTDLAASMYTGGGIANGATGIAVNGVTIGGTVMSLDNSAGGNASSGASWSGKLAGAVGAALTITTVGVVNAAQFLTASAYPV